FALAAHHCIVGHFDAFPSFVAVHSIISTYDGSYFSGGFIKMLLKIFQKVNPAFGIRITAISKSMNKHIFYFMFFANGSDCLEVIYMRMNTPIAYKAYQMQRLFILFGII